MSKKSEFVVYNDAGIPIFIHIEPEGAYVPLNDKEELVVRETHDQHPLTIDVSIDKDGRPVLSFWPGDGDMTVERDGKDARLL